MAKNSIYDYSTTAGSNTDINGIGILGTNAVNNFDDAFRTIMAQIATDVSSRRFAIQGALYGLTLANNAVDATNDIDIAVGMATTDSTTDPRTMVLSSALTKRLDATWAVGTNQGGLDTGSIANTTYHVWLIQRSDTNVVDALFSTSATSPTMPANYDRKRRIGSIIRAGATILAFNQIGDDFLLATPVLDVSVTNPGAAAVNRTLTVPTGIIVKALMNLQLINTGSAGTANLNINAITSINSIPPFTIGAVANVSGRSQQVTGQTSVWTNSSAQVRANLNYSDANVSYSIHTLGWTDVRGRLW